MLILHSHCKDNAALAHQLHHWRFEVNEWVVDFLKSQGHNADEEVLRRDKMKQKHKTKHAIGILDSMVQTGQVDKMYSDFHKVLKFAREKPEIRFKNGR